MTNKLPNRTTSIRRSLLAACLSAALMGGFWSHLSAQENPAPSGQKESTEAEKASTSEKEDSQSVHPQAIKTLKEARRRLGQYETLRAELLETVLLGSRSYQAKGEYVQARGNKIRQSFQLTVNGADGKPLNGSLLQVSNGSVMHSSHQIGDDLQVSRRDVKQIMKTIEQYPSLDAEMMKTKLGLGGLPALLVSLETSFDFEIHRTETIQGTNFTMIDGGWNQKLMKQMLPQESNKVVQLPAYIPDRVRVYFDEKTYFPRRILYLKEFDKKLQPMLTLDFLNIQQNVPVSTDDFTFYPPEGAVSQDVTQGIIQQIIRAGKLKEKSESPDEKSGT